MESAGLRLKKLRLEKGLSLDEVHKKTKVHLNILKAIEEDGLLGLSPVYIKGFLKIYCRFLEADPQEYIPDYKEPREGVSPFVKQSPSRSIIFNPNRKIIKIAIIAIAVIGLSVLLFNLGKKIVSRKHLSLLKDVKSVKALVKETDIEKKGSKPAKAKQVMPGKDITSEKRLVISVKEDCYVHVKTDGHTVFQGTLKKGRPEAWQAKEKIELSLGNAGVVDLEVNGQSFSNLGKKGQPLKNILIDKEGLSIKR